MDGYTYHVNELERQQDDTDHKVESIEEAFKKEIDEMKRTKKRIMSVAIAKGVEMHVEDMLREELML